MALTTTAACEQAEQLDHVRKAGTAHPGHRSGEVSSTHYRSFFERRWYFGNLPEWAANNPPGIMLTSTHQ